MDEPDRARRAAPSPAPARFRQSASFRVLAHRVTALGVLAAAALWAPAGDSRAFHQDAGQPQPVAVATVTRGDMPIVLTELGTVTPLATVTVQSQISGYLQEVNFTEGQDVKKGQLLALIDPRPYEVQIEQYTAQLAHDVAALKQARMDLARYQTLGKQNSIAKQTLDDQVYTVAQDEATTQVDQAQIDNAKLNLAYCHITSPVDGRVGLRQVDAGNYVTASSSTGLVVITEIKPISVIFTVTEDDVQSVLTKLQAGAALEVDAYDRTDTTKLASGTVETIDNQVDTSTGTVKLRANFPNDDERLFPNEFVNAHLLLDTVRNAMLIPSAAIQNGPQGTFVYVVVSSTENGKPVKKVTVKVVKTGYAHNDKTVVEQGLTDGDQVVIDGTDRLKDGAVIIVPTGNGAHHGHQAN